MKNDNSTKQSNATKPMLANRLFIDGNLLQEKDNKVFYKIYTEFAEPLVWQIGLGYWGTVKRFKKVVKERKIELEVLGNLFDNPELLTETYFKHKKSLIELAKEKEEMENHYIQKKIMNFPKIKSLLENIKSLENFKTEGGEIKNMQTSYDKELLTELELLLWNHNI